MRRLLPLLVLLLLAAQLPALGAPFRFYAETDPILDVKDTVGDDKGPGYYQYPLDKRIRRGTYDLKRFSVYEEDGVVTFVIQTREYIMTEWPDTHKSEEQGFVTNVFDIYVDLDGRPGTGYKQALPGRELEFADNKGWEKVILLTPLSEFRAYDILKGKTDDLSFQNVISDIILPDYVLLQRDKIVVRISKELLGKPAPGAGFQCLAMGFSRVVSPNRMLNMDVRAFPTPTDFGGGWDTYGDPPVMDLLMPEGQDQYETLRTFRSQPYRGEIIRATIPFLYSQSGNAAPPVVPVVRVEPVVPAPVRRPPATNSGTENPRPASRSPANSELPSIASLPPAEVGGPDEPAPRLFAPLPPRRAAPAAAGPAPAGPTPKAPPKSEPTGFLPLGKAASTSGFVPLKKTPTAKTPAKAPEASSEGGFIPLKKKP